MEIEAHFHQGKVDVKKTFREAQDYLSVVKEINLTTPNGTPFVAKPGAKKFGNELVIKFYQQGKEYGRAYECCWGAYYNCNRTRIGMYVKVELIRFGGYNGA